jgi:hypothetical protein
MLEGVTSETVDAMTLEKIDTIINALRNEKYRWNPCLHNQEEWKIQATRDANLV